MTLRRSLLAIALALAAGASTGICLAQEATGFDAHGFHLAAFDGDLRDPLQVARPGAQQAPELFGGALLELAKEPLVFVRTDAAGDVLGSEPVLDDLLVANLSLGATVHERLRLDLAFPLVMASSQGSNPGDLRMSAMLTLLSPAKGHFGLGFVPRVDLPTGAAAAYLGNAGLAGGGAVAATVEAGRLTASAEAGLQLQPALDLDNLSGSDQVELGAAVGTLVTDRLAAVLEARSATPLQASAVPGTAAAAEALLNVRQHLPVGAFLVVGGAKALSRGASAADWRLFAGGGWALTGPDRPGDLDGDGITDDQDRCPPARRSPTAGRTRTAAPTTWPA